MPDHRRFYVITSQGEAGPFTLEDLRNEIAAHRIDRNDRLRTAFGANLGTVGESVGPAPRNSSKSSNPRMSTPEGSSTRRGAGTPRSRTSDRTLPAKARPATPPTVSWLPLAIVGGVMAVGLVAAALWKSAPLPRSEDPSPAPAQTKLESPAASTPSPAIPAPTPMTTSPRPSPAPSWCGASTRRVEAGAIMIRIRKTTGPARSDPAQGSIRPNMSLAALSG